jgi:CBS domain containing-hemolysin-like protein
MEWIVDPTAWLGLLTLIVLELVLGIDNLIFIAILADKLPPQQRDRARVIGLSLALFMRVALLFGISWLVALTTPLFSVLGFAFSGRDLILLLGGLSLLFKATVELHERLEGGHGEHAGPRVYAGFWSVVAQIVVLDAVFSLDAVITAVGMVDQLAVMIVAVMIAIGLMIVASKPLTAFVNAHPTVVILCLSFLLMIGFSLVIEAFNVPVPKGYLYAAIGFSILIEAFNQIARRNRQRRLADGRLDLRTRTAEAVVRLLGGGRAEPGQAQEEVAALVAEAGGDPVFAPAEKDMIQGVLSLAGRPARSIMTPRGEVVWLDLEDPVDELRREILAAGHTHYPVARGAIDELVGVAAANDLLRDLLETGSIGPATAKPPVAVHEGFSALKLLELFRRSPTRFAVVLDEYGGIEGIVTPADILEAIAGEFPEDDKPRAVRADDGSWTLGGDMDVRRAARLLDRPSLAREDDYVTVAGYLLWHLGRLPKPGESLERDGLRFEILGATPRRIEQVRVTPVVEAAAS